MPKKPKYKDPRNKNSVFHMSSEEVALASKPRYNGYAVGHGAHGDTKYNRNKAKQATRREIEENY